MMQSNADSEVFEKLQANIMLGLGSNYFTIGGILGSWILLQRNEWLDGIFPQILTAMSLFPTFMGDALNSYFLGRVKLDTEKSWMDVQITKTGRERLIRLRPVWRALSLLAAGSLAAVFLSGFSADPAAWQWLKYGFIAFFTLHFIRCQHTQFTYVGPEATAWDPLSQIRRSVVLLFLFVIWAGWLVQREPAAFSKIGILFQGGFYFLLNSLLHPLPSRFSIFRLGGPASSRIPDKVIPLIPGVSDYQRHPALNKMVEEWQARHHFTELGPVRLPLIELPIFEACGEVFLSADRKSLLLLLKAEIRPAAHHTVLSWSGDKVLITTDFGAPNARLPDHVLYQTLPPATAPDQILQQHQAACQGPMDDIENPPWERLNSLIREMREFLRRTERPSVEQALKVIANT